MEKLYDTLSQKLSTLDFEAIYPGFQPYPFALYDQHTAWLQGRTIQRPEGFFGNTALEFEGHQLAIWYVGPGEAVDLDHLAADLVHEMFHAFQKDRGLIAQWPDDLMLLCYPENQDNHWLRQQEHRLLAQALEATAEEKRNILSIIGASRRSRRGLIGPFLDQELLVEDLEGQAECCSLLALKQLAPGKYRGQLSVYREKLLEDRDFLDIRKSCYLSGALLRLLGRDTVIEPTGFQQQLSREKAQKEAILSEFLAHHPTKYPISATICGYDPMNQFRQGDFLWARNLIFLQTAEGVRKLSGPLVLCMKPGSYREVLGWYQ